MTKLGEIYLRVLEAMLDQGAMQRSLEDTAYVVKKIVCALCKGHGVLREKQTRAAPEYSCGACPACEGTGLAYVQGNPIPMDPTPNSK